MRHKPQTAFLIAFFLLSYTVFTVHRADLSLRYRPQLSILKANAWSRIQVDLIIAPDPAPIVCGDDDGRRSAQL